MKVSDTTEVPTIKIAKLGLRNARQAHKAARAELQRIGALSTNPPDLKATRAAVEAAQAALADMSAAHALREVGADRVEEARSTLEAAEHAHQAAEADAAEAASLSEGLERRLAAAHRAEADAKAAVYRAENVLVLDQVREHDNCYTASSRTTAKHFQAARSAAMWLKYRDPSMVPAASASAASFQGLPTIGPISAADARKRSNGHQHGIGQMLYSPVDVRPDPDAFQLKMMLDADDGDEAAEQEA